MILKRSPETENPCALLPISVRCNINHQSARAATSAVVYFSHIAAKNPNKTRKATLDVIANLGGQVTSVERELKSIRRDLDDLREKVENVSGFQKEFDHALERIAAIEWHLGLDKKSPPDRTRRSRRPPSIHTAK
jgi:hypothetical protein